MAEDEAATLGDDDRVHEFPAGQFCRAFFPWYNDDHRHSGIGLHTPADVHFGRAAVVRERRGDVLSLAYAAHPERFVRNPPEPPQLPGAAWINRPAEEVLPLG